MKTEVVMKRELWGMEISQKSKSEFFSVTDLVKAGNRWRVSQGKEIFSLKHWLETKSAKEFMAALENKYGTIKINAKGKNQHTWVHPYLFIDIALAISPELKIEVYSWLHDYLLKYRNESGNSYKKLVGSVMLALSNKSKFQETISMVANKVKLACNVSGSWEKATEEQLKLRDKMHENISLLTDVLRDIERATTVGIDKTLKSVSHEKQKTV